MNTTEIERQFKQLIRHPENREEAILTFLQEHPTIDIDMYDADGSTLYMNLMKSMYVPSTSPLLQEVMKRRANPLNTGQGFFNIQTAAEKAMEAYKYVRDNRNFWGFSAARVKDLKEKARMALDYEEEWKARIEGILSLRAYKATSKNRLLTGKENESQSYLSRLVYGKLPSKARPALPENVEGKIAEFLTGEKGPINVQPSKAYPKLGLPGVPIRGGKKTRGKTRRGKTRKSRK